MNVYELLMPEEIEDAPDDPATAFSQLVAHAYKRLGEFTRQNDNEDGYRLVEEARYGFMNVVVGLGKTYNIEPFASYELPRYQEFDFGTHQQFKADLDHYLTQLLVDNSLRAKRNSVPIPPKVKDNIRSYLHRLKLAIDNANFSDAKRSDLHAKLAAFEAELEKSRLSLLAVTTLTFVILAVPGSLWASYDVVAKLTSKVLQAVGEAKAVDDDNRQLPSEQAPAALLPPREDGDALSTNNASPGDDLDDEIPF